MDSTWVYSVIPIIIDIHGHRFEIYTLVSKIHENVDIVLGIKYVFVLEGVINSQECCFSFLNRSIPISLKEESVEAERTETDKNRSTILRQNFRFGHNKVIMQINSEYNNVESQIYMKCSNVRYDE